MAPSLEGDVIHLGPEEDIPGTESTEIVFTGEDFEGELTNAFRRLQIGRAGLPASDGVGRVTARRVVQSFRDCASPETSELSEEGALIALLAAYEIPTAEAARIGILWGRAFPSPEPLPLEDFMSRPLQVRRRGDVEFPDLNIRKRPGLLSAIGSIIRRRSTPS